MLFSLCSLLLFCDAPCESRGCERETQRRSHANSLAPTLSQSVWLKPSSHPAAQPRGLAVTGAAACGTASVLFSPCSSSFLRCTVRVAWLRARNTAPLARQFARANVRPVGVAQATPPPSRAAWLPLGLGLLRVAPLAFFFAALSSVFFCDALRESLGCECKKQRPSHAHRKKEEGSAAKLAR